MDEKGDERVVSEIECLAAGGRRGHDDGRRGRIWRGRKVRVVHEGDVWDVVGGGGQMELQSKVRIKAIA